MLADFSSRKDLSWLLELSFATATDMKRGTWMPQDGRFSVRFYEQKLDSKTLLQRIGFDGIMNYLQFWNIVACLKRFASYASGALSKCMLGLNCHRKCLDSPAAVFFHGLF